MEENNEKKRKQRAEKEEDEKKIVSEVQGSRRIWAVVNCLLTLGAIILVSSLTK